MSKGLLALEELKKETRKGGFTYIQKSQKRYLHNIVEKELKAWEIFKRIIKLGKGHFLDYSTLDEEQRKNVSKEEYEFFVKEVLL